MVINPDQAAAETMAKAVSVLPVLITRVLRHQKDPLLSTLAELVGSTERRKQAFSTTPRPSAALPSLGASPSHASLHLASPADRVSLSKDARNVAVVGYAARSIS